MPAANQPLVYVSYAWRSRSSAPPALETRSPGPAL